MRVLWITNTMMPPIAEAKGEKKSVGGGWMYSSLSSLRKFHNMTLAVATIYNGSDFIRKDIDGIEYYLCPLNGKSRNKYNVGLEYYWREISHEFSPNIVHIHGSEYPHGLAYVKANGIKGVVVSIQGLISQYSEYYLGGISKMDCLKALSFYDFMKKNGILRQQKDFKHRGILELELLRSVKHIIGRTEWDKANTWAINPDVCYHHNNETMRPSFYDKKWEYDKCEPYSIFISQAGYPIKGFHNLIEALPIILRHFPYTKVYIPGNNIIDQPWYKISSYGKYIQRLINKKSLENNIIFLGSLDEEQMCARFLKSNLFICPSIIENSPNSLGEAQLLGMPYLSSICGGTPQLCEFNHNVLYRFEEISELAYKVCKIFDKGSKYTPPQTDLSIYDGDRNVKQLVNIYTEIANGRN